MMIEKRLFADLARAIAASADASERIPFPGQITWGLFFGAANDLLSPAANNNQVSSAQITANLFGKNFDDIKGYVPAATPVAQPAVHTEFRQSATKIVQMTPTLDLYVDHGQAMGHQVVMAPELESSDSFDSTNNAGGVLIEYDFVERKYKNQHLQNVS